MKKCIIATAVMAVGAIGAAYCVIKKADKIALGLERAAQALKVLAGCDCPADDSPAIYATDPSVYMPDAGIAIFNQLKEEAEDNTSADSDPHD